jgi:hypothetical protein
LTGGFKESEDKIVRLDEEQNGQIFEFFVHWLYYQRLPNKDDTAELYNAWADDEAGGEKMTENLIHLYVLSDKYDVPELKVQAMTLLFNHIEYNDTIELPLIPDIRFAFENLPEENPLCRYLVDAYCYWATADVWKDFGSLNWPTEFVARVLAQYTEFSHGDRDRDSIKVVCDYHEHQDIEERVACRKMQIEEEQG